MNDRSFKFSPFHFLPFPSNILNFVFIIINDATVRIKFDIKLFYICLFLLFFFILFGFFLQWTQYVYWINDFVVCVLCTRTLFVYAPRCSMLLARAFTLSIRSCCVNLKRVLYDIYKINRRKYVFIFLFSFFFYR